MSEYNEFTLADLKRIVELKQRRLDELEADWDNVTKHMEGGEYREAVQHCRDEETIIFVLKKYIEQHEAELRGADHA